MALALIPSEVVTDCFGVNYQRISVRGNGFCGFNSFSLCLTGNEEHYACIVENCIKVFTNFPELMFQRTNFGATNPTRTAVSQYYWMMRNAISRVRRGDSLTAHADEMFWMEDGHIIAICLLYDIAVFSYSTTAKRWYAFNEHGRNGYVCLLSSAYHTDVLHGVCDSSGRQLPPTIPQTFESQAVNPVAFNWSEGVAVSIQRQYSNAYVWPWPQAALSSKCADRQSSSEVDTQVCSEVVTKEGYYCDVAGCEFGPVQKVTSLTMHKIRSHRLPATQKPSSSSVAAGSPSHVTSPLPVHAPVSSNRACGNEVSRPASSARQGYYCDAENCNYGPVWKHKALIMHKNRCHSSREDELSDVLYGDMQSVVTQAQTKDNSCRAKKSARLSARANSSQEKETQQCPDCKKYVKDLLRHKKCPKKAPELSPMSPRKSNVMATEHKKSEKIMPTAVLFTKTGTVDESSVHRGRTQKTRLRQSLTLEVDKLKRDLQKVRKKKSIQCDPLYDKLKKFHDRMRKELCNTTTQKLPAEVVDVVRNTNMIGGCERKFRWTKNDAERLNTLNVECKKLQSRSDWTWGAPDNSPQGQYNDRRMQFCVEKECQWRIIECPQCLSTGILVGLDQIGASACIDCVQQQDSERMTRCANLKKKEAWEEVRPASQNYPRRTEPGHEQEDLPHLTPGDKAVIAPIHPVVTVKKNYFSDKKLKQESISLVQDCSPTLCKILPRTSLKDRFMIIERRAKDENKRYIVANPERVRQWLRYLFSHHKEFIRMRDNDELRLSEDAIKALESIEELAEVDDEMAEHGAEEAQRLEEETLHKDDGLVQPALSSGMPESHVFSFDRYPELYLKSKEILRVRKEGKIEIIEDSTVRRPSYCASASLAFPHLYPNGEKSPLDFQDYKVARYLLKKQALFAHRMSDGQLRWNYAADDIHMAHQYSRLNEQTVHATVGYYISQHPEVAHVSIDSVINAFKNNVDDQGLIDSHLPDLTSVMTQIPNTRERWFSERLGIESISRDLGDPNLFLTLNMDPRA